MNFRTFRPRGTKEGDAGEPARPASASRGLLRPQLLPQDKGVDSMASKAAIVMKELNSTDGVHETVVVGRDGFVIEHLGDMDAEAVGAIISTAIGAVEAMGRDTEQGSLFEVMAEFNEGVVICAPVGRDAVLGLVATNGCNLGRVRYAVKKNIRELERVL